MDRAAWQVTVHGVEKKSRTRLSNETTKITTTKDVVFNSYWLQPNPMGSSGAWISPLGSSCLEGREPLCQLLIGCELPVVGWQQESNLLGWLRIVFQKNEQLWAISIYPWWQLGDGWAQVIDIWMGLQQHRLHESTPWMLFGSWFTSLNVCIDLGLGVSSPLICWPYRVTVPDQPVPYSPFSLWRSQIVYEGMLNTCIIPPCRISFSPRNILLLFPVSFFCKMKG